MRLLRIAARISEDIPKTQRSPGIPTEITETDSEWDIPTQKPKTLRSQEFMSPDSDWKAVGEYVGVLKDTIEKLEQELPK